MSVEAHYPKLIAQLISMRAAIDGLLLELADQEMPDKALEKTRIVSGDCKHEKKVESMGGHWWCPVCGATG